MVRCAWLLGGVIRLLDVRLVVCALGWLHAWLIMRLVGCALGWMCVWLDVCLVDYAIGWQCAHVRFDRKRRVKISNENTSGEWSGVLGCLVVSYGC